MSWDLSVVGYTVFNCANEHCCDCFGCFFVDYSVENFWFGFGDFAVLIFNLLDNVWFHENSVVCESGISSDHLNRCDCHTLSE